MSSSLSTDLASAARVVIDTNALLDWLVFGEPAAVALADAVRAQTWVWYATPPMVQELRQVLARPLGERWQPQQKHALTIDIEAMATMCSLPPSQPVHAALVCRDPADQMFIDLAVDKRPCWLVTRDRALLALRRRAAAHGVVIAPPESWQRVHRALASA